MSIQFFCPRWGSDSLSWEAFGGKVSEAGYEGFGYGMACMATEAELHEV